FVVSFLRLIFEFPLPIIFAIMLNEVYRSAPKRIFQTILTFPNFLSWVVVVGVLRDLLQMSGLFNGLRDMMGLEPFNYLNNSNWVANMLLVLLTNVWKTAGWSSIIYLASMASIDPTLYEAATIDGASRWQCILHVTWPGIRTTAVVLLVLACGNILDAGFDQLFNLRQPLNIEHIEILDTYIYKYAFGLGRLNFSFTVAAGLFKSVINFALLLTANRFAGVLNGEGEKVF
ncbi:MAG: ABC transporter permease subunit, partial [Oscillospiraceae bacterium]|nr:ABC transporter permease subunit [Oscillospiraceae bacterium]